MMKRQDSFVDRKTKKFATSTVFDTKQSPFHIVEILSDTMTPTLVISPIITKQNEVIKIFNESNKDCVSKYLHESQFANLQHPNIITCHNHAQNFEYQDELLGDLKMSYILMEQGITDFFKIVTMSSFSEDEVLVRTYFLQLINAVEYLHSQKIYHMDLKLENLVLSRDFQLKVIDFGAAIKDHCKRLPKTGTIGYRPPEVAKNICDDFPKADIYNLGVVMFVMMTGSMPYSETENVMGYNLFGLLLSNPKKFWLAHKTIINRDFHFGDEFKNLFVDMTDSNPKKRPSLQQIKNSSWAQGKVYDAEELSMVMEKNIRHLMH
jgi:serine/threonine protein kinase